MLISHVHFYKINCRMELVPPMARLVSCVNNCFYNCQIPDRHPVTVCWLLFDVFVFNNFNRNEFEEIQHKLTFANSFHSKCMCT